MSTYPTTRGARGRPLAIVLLLVVSLLSIGQAFAADGAPPVATGEVEPSAMTEFVSGATGQMQTRMTRGDNSYDATDPRLVDQMTVTVPRNKSQFLVVEFSADAICSTATAGSCLGKIYVDGVELGYSTVIQVGAGAGTYFRAPITVRRQTLCLAPGDHIVEVYWRVNNPDMRSSLGNRMLTTYQSSTCTQG